MTLLDLLLDILGHIHNGSPYKTRTARWVARILTALVVAAAAYVVYVTWLRPGP